MHPTHTTLESSTPIDLFITNIDKENTYSGAIGACISDHLPIVLLVDEAMKGRSSCTFPKIALENITSFTLGQFHLLLSSVNWDHVFQPTSVHDAYDEFIAIIKPTYSQCLSLNTVKSSSRTRKPWTTRESLRLIQRKKHT